MRIVLYGGSFNPPHPAHVRAARIAFDSLRPDMLLIIPAADPPHKALAKGSPPPEERMELTRIAFRDFPEAVISDMELKRGGESYTSDTVRALMADYPGAEITLALGSDMLLYFEKWHEFEWLLKNVKLAALSREKGDGGEMAECAERLRRRYGANISILSAAPLPMSSSEIRDMLVSRRGADILDGEVYARIIKMRDYGARPELSWLRERAYSLHKPGRIAHVSGCEAEAVKLARRWGADELAAAEAAILHDLTKELEQSEQLLLCERYGIIIDNLERESKKLLHARTGAALARELFGVPDDIYDAIRWHTTGRPDMSLLEKIIYIADYIEPTRVFPGVDDMRTLAYGSLDSAAALGLEMCVRELEASGAGIHPATIAALGWYRRDLHSGKEM